MPTHLRRMRIGKVSLVDRGANGERIAILKAADGVAMPGTAEAMAAHLRSAHGASGSMSLPLAMLSRSHSKAHAAGAEHEHVSKEADMGDVAKGQPQFTEKRKARIRALRQELDDLLSEVDVKDDQVEKADTEDQMLDIERLAEELTPLLAPIIAERVDEAVSKAIAKAAPKATEGDVTLDTVVEAIGLLDGRLSDVEKARSVRQAAPIAGEVSKADTPVRATLAAAIL